jgi:3-isopropylmalate dehydrogenase
VQALRVLEVIISSSPDLDLDVQVHPFGGGSIDATGEALPAATLQACKDADAILMGG